jgi:hypothetical protein
MAETDPLSCRTPVRGRLPVLSQPVEHDEVVGRRHELPEPRPLAEPAAEPRVEELDGAVYLDEDVQIIGHGRSNAISVREAGPINPWGER